MTSVKNLLHSLRFFAAFFGCVGGLIAIGCKDEWSAARTATPTSGTMSSLSNKSVGEAMNYLPLLMRMDRTVATREVVYQLNSWAQNYPATDAWKPASLLMTLPSTSQQSPLVQQTGAVQFYETECEYLLQCRMMRDVAKWVTGNEYRDPVFSQWLVETGQKLQDADRRKLEATAKLFDWTVRNIALDGEARDAQFLTPNPNWPIDDGGIGYRQLPWQTLIFGRGDAWQRARVFTQLLQQVDLSGCVLAFPGPEGGPDQLWAIGVPIAGEIYLFEPKWGMPLPGPGESGIATLRQAREDRSVLRRANLPGQFDYPVDAERMSNVLALVDLEPAAMSHAMFALEPALTGENRMRVFVDPTDTLTALETAFGKPNVRLWNLPLLAQHYNMTVRARMFDQSPFSMRYLAVYGPFFTDTLINTARQQHFKAEFDQTIEKPGALKNYMSIRIDDATLEKLTTDREVQKMMQIVQGRNEPREAFVGRLEQVKAFYRVAKFHTSTFLGMAQFDLNNIDAAINWLDERTLQVEGTQAWHAHAEYLLARCYELTGDQAKTLDYLKREGRPQEAGNRIRARMIQDRKAPQPNQAE